MARTKLTRERIFEAADKLAAQGEAPTLEAVRQIVGGSFTTLGLTLQRELAGTADSLACRNEDLQECCARAGHRRTSSSACAPSSA